jgi:hypothetical protein
MTQPPRIHESPPPSRPEPRPVAGPAPAFGASDLTESVAARVQEILASAHETAESVREQAAAATRDIIAQAQATVDRDTERIRRDVEARAAQYLAECHRRVDAFADARVRRLRELSDSLIEQTDALHARFAQVVRLSEQLDALLASLGGAAEQTAREVKRPVISLPTVAQFHGEAGGRLERRTAERPLAPAAEPDHEPDPEPDPEPETAADGAADTVAAAASSGAGSAASEETAEPGPGEPGDEADRGDAGDEAEPA